MISNIAYPADGNLLYIQQSEQQILQKKRMISKKYLQI